MDRGADHTTCTELAAWLALFYGGQLPRREAKAIVSRWCLDQDRPLDDLLDLSATEAQRVAGISAQQATLVARASAQRATQRERLAALQSRQIGLLVRTSVAYPEALAERMSPETMPSLLFYRGPLDALTVPTVAILGQPQPSPETTTLVQELGQGVAAMGLALVGGYERGVDRIASNAARTQGGQAILVLPMGLAALGATLENLCALPSGGGTLLLSPFEPDAAYSYALAEARWQIVAALAEALLLVAPVRRPDEWPAMAVVLSSGRPVHVWGESRDPNVAAWVAAGARPFADSSDAVGALDERLAFGGAKEPADTTAVGTALNDDIEPPFADAEEAIAALARGGTVPDALARRLRSGPQQDARRNP